MKFLFLSLLPLFSSAQDILTAQGVIDRFIASSGGDAKMREIKSAKIEAIGISGKDTFFLTIVKLIPNKHIMSTTSRSGQYSSIYNSGRAVMIAKQQSNPYY